MSDPGDGGGESSRYDRELLELLNELRVALPGVQILFAFLLPVPFTQRWADVTDFQRDVFFVTLMAAAVATVLLIAPTAFHRIRFRQRDKRHLLQVANVFTIAGLVVLAVAMTGAILLVSDFLFGRTEALIAAGIIGALFFALWFALPLTRALTRFSGDDGPEEAGSTP